MSASDVLSHTCRKKTWKECLLTVFLISPMFACPLWHVRLVLDHPTKIFWFINPRLFLLETSEESCSCNTSWICWPSRPLNMHWCFMCEWNIWHLWICIPIAPSALLGMYYFWLMQFWSLIICIVLVNKAVNKHYFHVSFFLIYTHNNKSHYWQENTKKFWY